MLNVTENCALNIHWETSVEACLTGEFGPLPVDPKNAAQPRGSLKGRCGGDGPIGLGEDM